MCGLADIMRDRFIWCVEAVTLKKLLKLPYVLSLRWYSSLVAYRVSLLRIFTAMQTLNIVVHSYNRWCSNPARSLRLHFGLEISMDLSTNRNLLRDFMFLVFVWILIRRCISHHIRVDELPNLVELRTFDLQQQLVFIILQGNRLSLKKLTVFILISAISFKQIVHQLLVRNRKNTVAAKFRLLHPINFEISHFKTLLVAQPLNFLADVMH